VGSAEIFPAHEVFKKLGNLGLLGLNKPEAFGGAGLDYSYAMALAEALGHISCGGVPMAIGVQTDMCTPALARFGSDELRHEFLAPAIAGDTVGCIGVSEPGAGSDVAGLKSRARKDGDDYLISGQKMWITNSLQADWMCMLVNTSDGPVHRNKSLVMVPMNLPGIEKAKKIRKIGMHSSDTGLIYFDNVRVPQRYRIGEGRPGLRLPDAAVPGRAAVGRREFARTDGRLHCADHRMGAAAPDVRRHAGRPAVGAVQAGRAEDRSGSAARPDLPRLRPACAGRRRSGARIHGQAQDRAPHARRCPTPACSSGAAWASRSENRVSRLFRDGRLGSIGGGADEVMLGILAKTMGITKRPPRG
jgi:citronellyl-CoA dehydrogenase